MTDNETNNKITVSFPWNDEYDDFELNEDKGSLMLPNYIHAAKVTRENYPDLVIFLGGEDIEDINVIPLGARYMKSDKLHIMAMFGEDSVQSFSHFMQDDDGALYFDCHTMPPPHMNIRYDDMEESFGFELITNYVKFQEKFMDQHGFLFPLCGREMRMPHRMQNNPNADHRDISSIQF